ncbi:hypothetical protein SAMN05216251_10223 [Actinacidiphila alni]|uniref:Lipoprotein n=1 Tax=Actinacidiphila alni TaxID=380248 RepID=A0A1I1YH67_9ACTN|nr:hypothetical protein [Actinacidiphila alni]SFE18672.1 hypothetical protein SAMN05216251_10223 [Actinacidiphila alni]
MRARSALPVAALVATAALTLSACGGGSGGDGDSTISPVATATTSAAPTATSAAPSAAGAPLTVDPALALPADLRLDFDWTLPADAAQAGVLTASADFMQSMVHGVVRQNVKDATLNTYAQGAAYTYAKQYVQLHIDAKKTLTGTDHFYRPVVKLLAKNSAAQVTFCEDQSKLYSKEVATGKAHVTGADDRNYVSYQLVLSLFRPGTQLWRAQAITVKERALECKQ